MSLSQTKKPICRLILRYIRKERTHVIIFEEKVFYMLEHAYHYEGLRYVSVDSMVRLNIDRIQTSQTKVTSFPDHSSTKPSLEQVWPTVLKIFPAPLIQR